MEFDDLLKGLREFTRTLNELAKREIVKRGEGKFMGADVTYSYVVRYLSPYARPRDPPTKDSEKPLVEFFDRGDDIVVLAHMPNVKEEELKFRIYGDKLKIALNIAGNKVMKEMSIARDGRVDKILNASFKNGVLEIKLRKKQNWKLVNHYLQLLRKKLRTSKDKG
jgi:HSP20 family molecular chaperone IbpA